MIKKAKKYIYECLDTNWISSQGKFISKFEKKLSDFHKVKYCISTSSCTSALHLALLGIGIEKGDEVLCPNLSFIAPANMILLSGAKPILVDVDPETLNINPLQIKKKISKKTKAILVVHQFGHTADMRSIKKIALKYNLKIIEDNAESLGAKYRNKLSGTLGDISTLSFFANKIITTGEGGAILTNNRKIAEKIRILRDHGMSKNRKYYFVDLGFNYRMTNLQAALGFSQLQNLRKILRLRDLQLNNYKQFLNNNKNFYFLEKKSWCRSVNWLVTIILNKSKQRVGLQKFLKKNKIETRIMIPPIHRSLHFKKKFAYRDNDFKFSCSISSRGIHLPSSTGLNLSQIKYISSKVNEFFENEK